MLAKVSAVPATTVVVVTVVSGLGWRWLEPTNLRIPAELRIDATPTVSLGVAISRVLAVVHIHAAQAGTVTVVQSVGGVLAAAAAVWLAVRFRSDNLVRVLAVLLLVVVLAGPTLWPWYLTWGLVLLAATRSQRSRRACVRGGGRHAPRRPRRDPAAEWLLVLGGIADHRGRMRLVTLQAPVAQRDLRRASGRDLNR